MLSLMTGDAEYQRQLRAAEEQARRTIKTPSRGGCWKWAIPLIALPILAVLGLALMGRNSRDTPRLDFYVACQSAVRDRLQAPSTAEFGPETVNDVQGSPSNFRLTGSVEAQNALGVPIRTAYTCTGTPEHIDVGIF